MTVLTKAKTHHKTPRCEAITKTGKRCSFASSHYVNGKSVCLKHSPWGVRK